MATNGQEERVTPIDELLVELKAAADEPIGGHNIDAVQSAADKLEEILAKLRASIDAVIAEGKAALGL